MRLVVRTAGEESGGEGVRVLEKMVRVLPWPVLLSQAAMVGPAALTHGRIVAALHRGVAAAKTHRRELQACARQISLHLTSLLLTYESDAKGAGGGGEGAARSCHELLELLHKVLESMWARVLAAKEGGDGGAMGVVKRVREECDVLVETSEQLLANNALRALFLAACAGTHEGGDGRGGGDVPLLSLAVTHGMSRAIDFLLSRPWPTATLGGRTQGPALALTEAARPYW